ncbi:IS256 family transposase [Kroppenstedtia eburnea]|uniref:IS256 family transposase n=1 Tax=Kroppenstedtia eburnea TaxID=714067 RepID=UPI00156200AD|nr:IS256 family transposase [Kroppenstedtia eburnea]QKI82604.1 IS256 family transposase [Kroppenstedtia eburnea]
MKSLHEREGKFQNDTIQLSLTQIMESAKEGLLALAVQTGLQVFQAMMQEEVTQLAGPKGKHNPNRKAVRHGVEQGSVVLGGRKVRVEKPRVRSVEGEELHLEVYQVFQDPSLLTDAALERMIHGLSTRNYEQGLGADRCGWESKFHQQKYDQPSLCGRNREKAGRAPGRRLDDRRYPALMIDGVVMADHTVVVALGVDEEGKKHILGLWEGATENAPVCKSFLMDLVDRGLSTDRGILVIIDGSKALRSAIRDVLGKQAVVQRCQVHKLRNVLDHLPERERGWVERKIKEAWRQPDADKAHRALKRLANQLDEVHPGAAASLREGMEETLTVIRLGLSELLQTTLRSTNAIESAFKTVRDVSRNVKRWRNGQQVLRWSAAGLLEAETRFRRIKGYRQLPLLKQALEQHIDSEPKENKPITA